jgi:hypothetical protein
MTIQNQKQPLDVQPFSVYFSLDHSRKRDTVN